MGIALNIIIIGLGAFFLSIPLLNTQVFHTVNVDEIVVLGRESLNKIVQLQSSGNYDEARDSARAVIRRFRNDPSYLFGPDIIDWNAALVEVHNENGLLAKEIWSRGMSENDSVALQLCVSVESLTPKIRETILSGLNSLLEKPDLFSTYKEQIESDSRLKNIMQKLLSEGTLVESGGKYQLASALPRDKRQMVRLVNIAILEKSVYPKIIKKDQGRNSDWASEYTTQTAFYHLGNCFRAQFENDSAIKTFDTLIALYPKTIYAEALFLTNGQLLLQDGKKQMENREIAAGEKTIQRAIYYLKKIEMNREISREFPKYKYSDLQTDMYVNIDVASRAKSKIKEKTAIYTLAQAKQELSGKSSESEGGSNLEDAIKTIGDCYQEIGQTDSARSQYKLILDFFPESDNLAPAQKLIADSYVRDGDRALGNKRDTSDTDRAKAHDYYNKAVSAYLKFVNVYPQSKLISDVYVAMGDVYYKLGQPKKANETFEYAIDLAKVIEDKAKVQLKIGNYYLERKQFANAISSYEIILKNFSSTEVASNAQYLLGQSYESLGDTVKAIGAYQIIVDYYKKSTFFGDAAFKIGNTYFEQENFKKALEAYKLGKTYDPNGNLSAKTQFQIGMVWKRIAETQAGDEKEKDYKESIREFSVVVKEYVNSDPRQADQASYQIAECYMGIGNEKAAQEAVRSISSRDILLTSIKLFGIGAQNVQDEVNYWDQAFRDALEDEERASALYEKAMVLTDKIKDYPAALETFKKVLEYTKDFNKLLNARIGISRVYNAMERYTDAQNTLNELLSNTKNMTPDVMQNLEIQLNDAYYKGGDIEKALEGFDRFTSQYPENSLAAFAYYRIGSMFADRKEYQAAMDKFQIVIDKYKDSNVFDKAKLAIGTQIAVMGDPEKAVEYLSSYIKENPEVPSAMNIYLKIADLYEGRLGKKELALEIYNKAINSYPDDLLVSYASFKCGMAYKAFGEDAKAIERLKQVKKENKAIYRAAQAEVGKLIAKTDPAAAIANYRQIVQESESQEDSATALVGIGDVYTTTLKWDEAAKTFEQVHSFYNGNDTNLAAGAIIKWVDALFNGKKYQETIKAAHIMQQKYPASVYCINTYYYEAQAYFMLKNYGKSREVFQHIIELNQSEQLAEISCYQIGETYYFAKEWRPALTGYDNFIKKYPAGKFVPRAYYMKGNIYWQMEDFQNARVMFEKVVTQYPDFDDICNAKNFFAYCLNRTDRYKEAERLYEQVIKGACQKSALDFAKEQLDAIRAVH